MRIKRWAVIWLLFAWLTTLLGCNKDKYILDGPGMINPSAWDTFSVSRSGDSYAQHNFDITVSWSNDGYVVKGTLLGYEEEEEGILLSEAAYQQIDALNPGNLPDVVRNELDSSGEEMPFPLDAPTVQIEVVYVDGRTLSKVDQDDFSIKVYEIVLPYFENQ